MKLWRLTTRDHVALDGAGAATRGGRYWSPGLPIVSFASEAGLAVLVVLRYVLAADDMDHADHVLGWTEATAIPERIPSALDDGARQSFIEDWARSKRSLLVAIQSAVLPEADVILMNAAHAEAATLPPLTCRPFSFRECLHRPPVLDHHQGPTDQV